MRKLNALLLMAVMLAPSWAAAADKVYPKNGVPASGKIKSISRTEVVITARGKDQKFAIGDILKVAFDGEPSGLERARDQYLNGQYDQALEEIKKLGAEDANSEQVRQDIVFYRWFCEGKQGMVGQGDVNKAIAGLSQLASKNANSHHMLEISAALGELNMSIGKPDEAIRYYAFLARATDPALQLQGKYQLGMADLAKDDVAGAKAKLEQVSKQKTSSPEEARFANLAKVGVAICLQREGDVKTALSQLNALAKKLDNTDHDLYGRVINARGQCYKATGNTKFALQDFLMTDLMFFTAAEPHAEALYELQSLWQSEGNPIAAAAAKKKLTTQYASSVWASKP